MIKVLFNNTKGNVKRYKTLNYEGTQARVTEKIDNQYQLHDGILPGDTVNYGQVYYDNLQKTGWYVENIETDLQEGRLKEFIDKEIEQLQNQVGGLK